MAAPSIPGSSRWPWSLAAACFLLYVVVGIWLLKVQGYAIDDSLARTITAQNTVLSRDPHLGVLGFAWPPVPTLIRIPFVVLLAPFGQTILAGPISSALAVALTVPVLARLGDELGLHDAVTALFVVLFALNPVTVFVAANGMSEATFVAALALTGLGYVRYVQRGTVDSLALVGLALGLGMASRIEFIPISIATVAACALNASRDRARQVAWLVVLPPAMAFVVWSLASQLQLGDPWFWYTHGRATSATPDVHPWMPDALSTWTVVGHVAVTSLAIAPAIAVALAVGLSARRRRREWFGLVLVTVTLPVFLAVQLMMRLSFGIPRHLMPLVAASAITSMWTLARTRGTGAASRRLLVALALASLFGGAAATLRFAGHDASSADGEYVFFAPLLGRSGDVADATRSSPLFVGDLSLYDDLCDDLDPFLAEGRFVAMDSVPAAPLLETRHRKQFIIPDDRDFEEILSDAAGRFDFIVVQPRTATSGNSELLAVELDRHDGGRWTQVGDYGGVAIVYEWVLHGEWPTFQQS